MVPLILRSWHLWGVLDNKVGRYLRICFQDQITLGDLQGMGCTYITSWRYKHSHRTMPKPNFEVFKDTRQIIEFRLHYLLTYSIGVNMKRFTNSRHSGNIIKVDYFFRHTIAIPHLDKWLYVRLSKPRGNGPKMINENVKWNCQSIAEALIKWLNS